MRLKSYRKYEAEPVYSADDYEQPPFNRGQVVLYKDEWYYVAARHLAAEPFVYLHPMISWRGKPGVVPEREVRGQWCSFR